MDSLRRALEGPVLEAARALLGAVLISDVGGARAAVCLVEVEAYGGGDDPASHAFRGPTPRNRAMFGPPGTFYVYRSYGVHWCANVVTGPEGIPAAVLLRAGEPVQGREVMEGRRGRPDHLTDGPGKLCRALGLTGDHCGISVWEGPVRLTEGDASPGVVAASTRIGVTRGVDLPWRLTLRTGRM
jgi:DNA-3-methyladenine glycosylase